ncbi:PDR/VanB family oxidoreductase [Gordonia jinhuaensis]|uniref:Ferredoxin n=1 Tax=Gordonia jinhuaensis TaxID=1517702 RepID=A0A916THU5_9ACTN|nr:PDR/VanB family oxidoreductase [Gordonia jinhuaensis]GGB45643.1 ferredoxin [Gordonia jinhuaensis]
MVEELALVVTRIRDLGGDIRAITLADPEGEALPSFTAGSHLGVAWAPGQRNSYSLTSSGVMPHEYSIAVRRNDSGRGGSSWMHSLGHGACVYATSPVSAFAPVATATHHVLVAGGIGVTPVLSHVREALTWGRSFEVIYRFRPGAGAYADELSQLCGERLAMPSDRSAFDELIDDVLTDRPLGTHLYMCGPAQMIADVAERARRRGWPAARLHAEAFAAAGDAGGTPFRVDLAMSGSQVEVDSDVALLDALIAAGLDVPHLCRQGVCGQCATPVAAGDIDHRDSYLTADERNGGRVIMPCVSRAAGERITLDL